MVPDRGGLERRHGGGTPQTYEGWCCHQPSLPWDRPPCLAAWRLFPGGSGSGRDLATSLGSLSGFRPKPCGLGRSPAGAPPKQASMKSLSRFLCPKAPVPPDVVGKWERHRLSPLPHASSFDRPASRLPAIILADVRRFRGGSDQQLRPFPARCPLVTKINNARASGVAPSGIGRRLKESWG